MKQSKSKEYLKFWTCFLPQLYKSMPARLTAIIKREGDTRNADVFVGKNAP